MIISETQKAYIAGMLDADGCVGISRRKSKSDAYEWDFAVRIVITNTNYDLIFWLKDVTGIGCAFKNKTAQKKNWNVVHRWQVVSNQAIELLEEILPYMIIKRDRAEKCLNMPHQGHLGKKRSIEDYKKQTDLYYELKKINKRGT